MNTLVTSLTLLEFFGMPVARRFGTTLVQMLTIEDLWHLFQALRKPCNLRAFVQAELYFRGYFNRAERAICYNFYDHPYYTSMEKAHTEYVAESMPCVVKDGLTRVHHIETEISRQFVDCADDVKDLLSMVYEPGLPLPPLKRANQAAFCGSPLQVLVALRHFSSNKASETPFMDIESSLADSETFLAKQMQRAVQRKNKPNSQFGKFTTLRLKPYEITTKNYGSLLIDGANGHNVLVLLIAMADAQALNVREYLSTITDPIQQFIQLSVRYSIYRNFIMEIENNLGFAFENYEKLFEQAFEDVEPAVGFTFWRPALNRWFYWMSEFHEEAFRTYSGCLTHMRVKGIITRLSDEMQTLCLPIGNRLSSPQFEAPHLSAQRNSCLNAAHFIDTEPELYNVLLRDFSEYMVDLSLNQITVHWCGLSTQQLDSPFEEFSQYLVKYNRLFYAQIESCLEDVSEIDSKSLAKLKNVDLRICEELLKPCTLNAILRDNGLTIESCSSLCQKGLLTISSATGLLLPIMERDSKLTFYNTQLKIPSLPLPEIQRTVLKVCTNSYMQEDMAKSVETAATSTSVKEQYQSKCYWTHGGDVGSHNGQHNNSQELQSQSESEADETKENKFVNRNSNNRNRTHADQFNHLNQRLGDAERNIYDYGSPQGEGLGVH